MSDDDLSTIRAIREATADIDLQAQHLRDMLRAGNGPAVYAAEMLRAIMRSASMAARCMVIECAAADDAGVIHSGT